jgi:aryl-alcohol dehydrogenase-like predicted oxidoreductase
MPIPGAKNARQAEENATAAGWQLAEGELVALDAASDRLS